MGFGGGDGYGKGFSVAGEELGAAGVVATLLVEDGLTVIVECMVAVRVTL